MDRRDFSKNRRIWQMRADRQTPRRRAFGNSFPEIQGTGKFPQGPSGEVSRLLLRKRGGRLADIVAVDCALWPFRMGTNPFRKKRELSFEQKCQRTERLAKAHKPYAKQEW